MQFILADSVTKWDKAKEEGYSDSRQWNPAIDVNINLASARPSSLEHSRAKSVEKFGESVFHHLICHELST